MVARLRKKGQPRIDDSAVQSEVPGDEVQAAREALAACADSLRPARLVTLGHLLWTRYEIAGETDALVEAVQVMREAVADTAVKGRTRAEYAKELSAYLRLLYALNGDLMFLDEAIRFAREAVAAARRGSPQWATSQDALGLVLRTRFEEAGDSGALGEAIELMRSVIAATHARNQERPGYMSRLGELLQMCSEVTGSLDALAESERWGQEAVNTARVDDPERYVYLSNLGNTLLSVYERTGEIEALIRSRTLRRDAVVAIPPGHPERALCLGNLSYTLYEFYLRTGDPVALGEAVEEARDALACTPTGHADYAYHLSNLGNALYESYRLSGDTDVLAEAASVMQAAVNEAHDDDPAQGRYTSNLSIVFYELYMQRGEKQALMQALQTVRNAIAAIPDGDRDRAASLGNLAGILYTLYERTSDAKILAEALQVSRDTLTVAREGDLRRFTYLQNLAVTLVDLYLLNGDAQVLIEAVEYGRDAVSEIPNHHSDRPELLNTLARSLVLLHRLTGDTDTAAEAEKVARDAVAAVPDTHPERASHLIVLGEIVRDRYRQAGDADAFAEARQCFADAAASTVAAPAFRIRGYRALAELATGTDAGEALAAAEAAVGLLEAVVPGSLTSADRMHLLGKLAGLASQAALAALAAGQPRRAVELLEQTRGVLVAGTLDARGSDRDRLSEQYPALVRRLDQIRADLDASDGADAPPDDGTRRQQAYADWQELTAQIRALPGFEDFHRPQASQLTKEAVVGPIVFVVAGDTHGDALILTGDPDDPVLDVRLPELSQNNTATHAEQLQEALDQAFTGHPAHAAAAREDIRAVLAWLWDTVAGPVLSKLDCTLPAVSGATWDRVWWCPVGSLAFLPLHAAGRHSDLGTDAQADGRYAVLDRVTSSYTTTVRALAYARTRRTADIMSPPLVIAAADIPGAELPGVRYETNAIAEAIPGTQVLTDPSPARVLEALPSHGIAHFACHGRPDLSDPGASYLSLPTGQLTVAQISGLELAASLAYLSACSTAVTSRRLADESVHLSGAFQLAGYQQVIGTLWPISDDIAGTVSAEFYHELTANADLTPDISEGAVALHKAVRRVRARYPDHPEKWAAYTHYGI